MAEMLCVTIVSGVCVCVFQLELVSTTGEQAQSRWHSLASAVAPSSRPPSSQLLHSTCLGPVTTLWEKLIPSYIHCSWNYLCRKKKRKEARHWQRGFERSAERRATGGAVRHAAEDGRGRESGGCRPRRVIVLLSAPALVATDSWNVPLG